MKITRRFVLPTIAFLAAGVAVVLLVRAMDTSDPLDPTTPRQQAGFQITHLALQERKAPISAFLLGRFFPFLFAYISSQRGILVRDDLAKPNAPLNFDDYELQGRLSDGSFLSLPLGFTSYGNGTSAVNIELPEGFPDNTRWLEVTLREKRSGRFAVWRLRDLPRAWHTVDTTQPLSVKTTQTVHQVNFQARAWWDNVAQNSPVGWMPSIPVTPLICEIRGQRPGPSSSSDSLSPFWKVVVTNVLPEWAPPSRQLHPAPQIGGMNSSTPNGRYAATGINGAFLDATHYTRIEGAVCEYEPLREQVTFRNLPITFTQGIRRISLVKPLTQSTASGIIVTLGKKSNSQWSVPPAATLHLSAGRKVRLPGSPVFRKYGKEVSVRLDAITTAGNGLRAEYQEDSPAYSSANPGPTGQFFIVRLWEEQQQTAVSKIDLTVTIEQQAEIRRTPLSFLVPMTKGKPKEDWR